VQYGRNAAICRKDLLPPTSESYLEDEAGSSETSTNVHQAIRHHSIPPHVLVLEHGGLSSAPRHAPQHAATLLRVFLCLAPTTRPLANCRLNDMSVTLDQAMEWAT
jgi:hypothetical protein